MNKSIYILTTAIFYCITISCQQRTNDYVNIEINSDSCIAWSLPNINLTFRIPKEYKIDYNVSGGFYLQAHKFNEKYEVVSQISFGRIEGNFIPDSSIFALYKVDSISRIIFKEIHQQYSTSYIGIDTIYDEVSMPQIRNYVLFENFNDIFKGTYYGFSAPIFIDLKNRFMISAIFSESEKFSDERMIGVDLIEVLKSIKSLNTNY